MSTPLLRSVVGIALALGLVSACAPNPGLSDGGGGSGGVAGGSGGFGGGSAGGNSGGGSGGSGGAGGGSSGGAGGSGGGVPCVIEPTVDRVTARAITARGDSTCTVTGAGAIFCWGDNVFGELGDGASGLWRAYPVKPNAPDGWNSVSLGDNFACAVRPDAGLWCWGTNSEGRLGTGKNDNAFEYVPVPATSSARWNQVSAGAQHACGTDLTGTLYCWGSNAKGQLGLADAGVYRLPTALNAGSCWASVSAGTSLTCAVRLDGTLWCWGAGPVGDGTTAPRPLTGIAAAESWAQVSVGNSHACAIRADRQLACWGSNDAGQLGLGTGSPATVLVPTLLADAGAAWAMVSAGGGSSTSFSGFYGGPGHTCATRTDGTLWCWGDNRAGQLGDGNGGPRVTAFSAVPIQVPGTDWAAVATGFEHTCAIRQEGTVRCWGRNVKGALGVGTSAGGRPVPIAGAWKSVSAGNGHTCALAADGGVWCWGNNRAGEVGETVFSQHQVPWLLDAGAFASVSASGVGHSCGVRTTGEALCWGHNGFGQLGVGDAGEVLPPTRVAPGMRFASIAAGSMHTCALDADGGVWCWGRNDEGEVGDGTTVTRFLPTRIDAGSVAGVVISSGAAHSCVVTADQRARCWGAGAQGRIGDSLGSHLRPQPSLVDSNANWVEVSAGGAHTLARDAIGSAWSWGGNFGGELGTGTSVLQNLAPVRVDAGTDWAQVSAGTYYSCAIRTDGTLWCWGSGRQGALGLLSPPSIVPAPAQVGTDTTWRTVSTGAEHACGTRTDATLWCWGTNDHGELGDGSAWKTTPVTVPLP